MRACVRARVCVRLGVCVSVCMCVCVCVCVSPRQTVDGGLKSHVANVQPTVHSLRQFMLKKDYEKLMNEPGKRIFPSVGEAYNFF